MDGLIFYSEVFMAAKSIQEAITQGILTGRRADVFQNVANHLRDFFSHEVMRYQHDLYMTPMDEDQRDEISEHLKKFFDRVFKDIPAVSGSTASALMDRGGKGDES